MTTIPSDAAWDQLDDDQRSQVVWHGCYVALQKILLAMAVLLPPEQAARRFEWAPKTATLMMVSAIEPLIMGLNEALQKQRLIAVLEARAKSLGKGG